MGKKAVWESADTQHSTAYLEGTYFMTSKRTCEVVASAAVHSCMYWQIDILHGLVCEPQQPGAVTGVSMPQSTVAAVVYMNCIVCCE